MTKIDRTFEEKFSLWGKWIGILGFILLLLLPPQNFLLEIISSQMKFVQPEQIFSVASSIQKTFALLFLMIVWWLTEAVPIPVTAMLPIVFVPVMNLMKAKGGVVESLAVSQVLKNYSDPIVFLFMGSFLLAAALMHHNLDKRWALWMLSKKIFAQSPERMILGLVVVTSLLSMWMNNTATAAMMIPLALGIVRHMSGGEIISSDSKNISARNFAAACVLAVAWASSIGGLGTIVGTAPNGIAVSVLRQQKIAIVTFTQWLWYGIPAVLLMIPMAWLALTKIFPVSNLLNENLESRLNEERKFLGKMSTAQKRLVIIFVLTALAWIFIPLVAEISLPETKKFLGTFDIWLIAIGSALVMFLIPDGKGSYLLTWKEAHSIDWGTLLLFGGGLAMAALLFETGGGEIITYFLSNTMKFMPPAIFLLVLIIALNFLTEITSNTALASLMVPLIIPIAQSVGIHTDTAAIATALACSLGFMLPIATPPNAIAYATGVLNVRSMMKAGFWMDILGCIAIWLAVLLADKILH